MLFVFFYLVIKCVNQKEEVVTRKSEKQQVIAFIDYENCSNLTEVALNIYTELIIFAGAKQNNVALPVNAFHEAVRVTLRHVSEVSRNNVDFHLVLELGHVYATTGRRRNTILFPLTRDMTVLSGHCRRAGFAAVASPRIRRHQ